MIFFITSSCLSANGLLFTIKNKIKKTYLAVDLTVDSNIYIISIYIENFPGVCKYFFCILLK